MSGVQTKVVKKGIRHILFEFKEYVVCIFFRIERCYWALPLETKYALISSLGLEAQDFMVRK